MKQFPVPSFSHSGEDRLAVKLLSAIKNGFYVDVGCYHPVNYSNTYLLSKTGWRGLCVDADDEFLPLYSDCRPNDHVVNVGVGEVASQQDLYIFYDRSLNTFSHEQAKIIFKSKGVEYIEKRKIKIVPLQKLLIDLQITRVDYLNIDVEGRDLEVLKSLDFSAHRPALITIEDHELNLGDIAKSNIFCFLEAHDYKIHSKVNYTSFYVKKT
jgi:FkbM family methyltransferase